MIVCLTIVAKVAEVLFELGQEWAESTKDDSVELLPWLRSLGLPWLPVDDHMLHKEPS